MNFEGINSPDNLMKLDSPAFNKTTNQERELELEEDEKM